MIIFLFKKKNHKLSFFKYLLFTAANNSSFYLELRNVQFWEASVHVYNQKKRRK